MEERHFEVDLPEKEDLDSISFKDYFKQSLIWSVPLAIVLFFGPFLVNYLVFVGPSQRVLGLLSAGNPAYAALILGPLIFAVFIGIVLFFAVKSTLKKVALETYWDRFNFAITTYFFAALIVSIIDSTLTGTLSLSGFGLFGILIIFIIPAITKP